jgi:hypothetical protein
MSEAGTDGTTIFSDQSGEVTAPPTTPGTTNTGPIIPDEAKEFVGEGKKYATIEDALKSVPYAQKYIDEQKVILDAKIAEAAELKAELEKKKSMEDYLDNLKKQGDNTTTPPPDISGLVEQKMAEIESNKVVQANLLAADAAMKAMYGEKAKEAMVSKAAELNVSVAYLTQLAATSPAAFYKMLDIKKSGSMGSKTDASLNTERFNQDNDENTSARIVNKVGATTKDMVTAWRNAKPKN